MDCINLVFRWPYWFILFHLLLGFIGFVMYCFTPNARPKKIWLYPLPFMMHHLTGLLGLFYGYVCFSNRNNVSPDSKTKEN